MIAHILVRMLHQLHLMTGQFLILIQPSYQLALMFTADTKIRFEMDEKTAKRAILIPVVAEVQQQDQLPTMMRTNVLKTVNIIGKIIHLSPSTLCLIVAGTNGYDYAPYMGSSSSYGPMKSSTYSSRSGAPYGGFTSPKVILQFS